MALQGVRYLWHTPEAEAFTDAPALIRTISTRRAPEQTDDYLNPELSRLTDPFTLHGMSAAMDVIAQAIKKNHSILVYGDYDVDGTVATAMLVRFLRELGGTADYIIPNRFIEGYGLHRETLEQQLEHFDLLITVDCGITGVEEIAWLKKQGKQVIITDHHLPGPELPAANAIINPSQPHCPYPHAICGATVALKLITALRRHLDRDELNLSHYLPLAALATVADVMEILAENRIIVKHGLRLFASRAVTGLKALSQVAQIDPTSISAYHLGFQLGPRLNAAGRLDDAKRVVELLLLNEEQWEQALTIATELDSFNRERQEVEQQMLQEAQEIIETHKYQNDRAIVVAKSGWNEGVVGIVASRIKSRYHRPAIVCSILPDGRAKGSCRFVEGVHGYDELARCSKLLDRFGGHAMAAGLQLPSSHINSFRRLLLQNLNRYPAELFVPQRRAQGALAPELLTVETAAALQQLEPFGNGNSEPVFLTSFTVLDTFQCGRENSHCKVTLLDKLGRRHQAIAFSNNLQPWVNRRVILCYRLRQSTFRQQVRMELQIEDVITKW
ncbi:single-stranded-DNA-specific exonuclease RecJ [Desulfurispira natronophila]|uniref:Single-stranded-DNA-specific exonuclease RecJ n=1 Tax=Desulfurispira natronophila TaxID=682562 RepID=A0A7W7Y394_9BACT|nr:single-stranded-DNA-specific exonuclease RecJ [Desulfurispira natronophila]MBB5021295.1 single-stranded-DNA-specific exonuclease [Desulfurispira natronophila]